jgi:hypothetical protein
MNGSSEIFLGRTTRNFTITPELFANFPTVQYWRFEVIYAMQGSASMDFLINTPPSNGTCSITPITGTTSTVFTLDCSQWMDIHGMKDYSFYIGGSILGYSVLPTLQVQLPANGFNSTQVNLIARIRDIYGAFVEVNLSPVTVMFDLTLLNDLIEGVRSAGINLMNSSQLNGNPLVPILASGNQNLVSQTLAAQIQALNAMTVTSPVSGLNSERVSASNMSISADINIRARVRDYLSTFVSNLVITNLDSITLQSSLFAQLTEITGELTRETIAATRCYQLARALQNLAATSTYESIQSAVESLDRCASQTLTVGFCNGEVWRSVHRCVCIGSQRTFARSRDRAGSRSNAGKCPSRRLRY